MTTTTEHEGLRAQQKLIDKLERDHFNWDLLVGDAFVRGMRDIGYKSTSFAIGEIIDTEGDEGVDASEGTRGELEAGGPDVGGVSEGITDGGETYADIVVLRPRGNEMRPGRGAGAHGRSSVDDGLNVKRLVGEEGLEPSSLLDI